MKRLLGVAPHCEAVVECRASLPQAWCAHNGARARPSLGFVRRRQHLLPLARSTRPRLCWRRRTAARPSWRPGSRRPRLRCGPQPAVVRMQPAIACTRCEQGTERVHDHRDPAVATRPARMTCAAGRGLAQPVPHLARPTVAPCAGRIARLRAYAARRSHVRPRAQPQQFHRVARTAGGSREEGAGARAKAGGALTQHRELKLKQQLCLARASRALKHLRAARRGFDEAQGAFSRPREAALCELVLRPLSFGSPHRPPAGKATGSERGRRPQGRREGRAAGAGGSVASFVRQLPARRPRLRQWVYAAVLNSGCATRG